MTTPENEIPVPALDALKGAYSGFLLMGAHARDQIVQVRAGVSMGRTTRDFDLGVLVTSLPDYRVASQGLMNLGTTGMSFLVEETVVDLIPFDRDGGLAPIVELVPGVQMDVTGLDEAFATAEPMPRPYEAVRLPSLHALVVLKTIAWQMRGLETSKDATDIGLLLRCVCEGEFEERCFSDLDLLATRDGDPERVGAFLTGRDAVRDLPRATMACRASWVDEGLVHAIGGRSGTRLQRIRTLLEDLYAGSSSE